MKGDHAVWLHLCCPCRCGAVLRVNPMKSCPPYWNAAAHVGGRFTVEIDVTSCGSHFLICKSCIHWLKRQGVYRQVMPRKVSSSPRPHLAG